MDLIQLNGQPQYGRFTTLPTRIDYTQYHYKTSQGDLLTGWRKRLKYKKYKFCSIQHEDYSIAIGIADLAWVGYGFVYIYQHSSGDVLEWQGSNLLARHTHLDEQPLFNQSEFQKAPFHIAIEHAHGVRYIRVSKHGEIWLRARIFCASTDPLSLCRPTCQKQHWGYTQKLSTLGCEGFFLNKKGQLIAFNDKSFVSLDDGCGFYPSKANWQWLSCNFWDKNNNRIGLNLASHVSDHENENCLWINGVMFAMEDVQFDQLDEQHWHIYSQDHQIDLHLETTWIRTEKVNFRFVGSQYQHCQTKIMGTIIQHDQIIHLQQEYGLFEHHNHYLD